MQAVAIGPIFQQPRQVSFKRPDERITSKKIRDAPALKVALMRYIVISAKSQSFFFSQYALYLIGRKHIILALLPLAVSILSAVKAAVGRGHFPQHIVCRSFCGVKIKLCPALILCKSMSPAICKHQQGVIIQHLFKMRHQKVFICGIPAEATTYVVKYASPIHLHQGMLRHIQAGFIVIFFIKAQQKQQIVRCGKLWRPAKAAVYSVKRSLIHSHCLIRQLVFILGSPVLFLGKVQHHYIRPLQQFFSVRFPLFMEYTQQLPHAYHAAPAVLWIICAGKKRPLFRRHKNAGGPAAASGKGLTHAHVYAVYIRPLLFIHLDADIVFIQQFRYLLILKALVGHNMTPMACAVSDA